MFIYIYTNVGSVLDQYKTVMFSGSQKLCKKTYNSLNNCLLLKMWVLIKKL